tara:strand:- start:745 stop:1203 length:459 start_codon:yes stop_codon:yes gene_type:complete
MTEQWRYNKSFIYKCFNSDTDDVYIGSTIQNPKLRYTRHIFNAAHGIGNYGKIFETPNHTYEIIDNCNFNCRRDLLLRERHWIDITPNAVNKMRPAFLNDEERKANHYANVLRYYRSDKGKVNKKNQNARYRKKIKGEVKDDSQTGEISTEE